MLAISQLLLTRFWQNFKVRSLGPSWTDFNCHRDICPGNICHDDICPCPEYLSCYRPDFDQTLKVDSWDHLDLFQLSWRHLFRQHLSWQHLSISGISRLLLTRFWPNFKSRLLGPCWTDSNCHGNICPGNICPYQEYLSCYCPDFDQTLKVDSWDHLELFQLSWWHVSRQHLSWRHLSIIRNISVVTDPILTKLQK